jgi:hypothetical protein
MAISSGVKGLEAAVVVTDGLAIAAADADAIRDFAGRGVTIYRADTSGVVVDAETT